MKAEAAFQVQKVILVWKLEAIFPTIVEYLGLQQVVIVHIYGADMISWFDAEVVDVQEPRFGGRRQRIIASDHKIPSMNVVARAPVILHLNIWQANACSRLQNRRRPLNPNSSSPPYGPLFGEVQRVDEPLCAHAFAYLLH